MARIFVLVILLLSISSGAEFELRLGGGERDFQRYKDYRYNAVMMGDLGRLVTYSNACPDALPMDSTVRREIEGRRTTFAKSCQAASDAGLAVCVSTDEVSLPKAVFELLRNKIARKDRSGRIDLESEGFWALYRAKYREVLATFPQIAYVMIRTGENYSHLTTDYIGQTIRDGDINTRYYKNMQRLMAETRKIVVDEFGRKLIWRTWDLGNSGFHADTNVYDRVQAGVKERKGLIFAVKFTQTDFWQYNDFNPNIGRGNVDQIIEFQCAREYEGKGAFPNYVGPEHAAALKKAQALGAKGVWIWDFGGGWGGPFLQNDRWVRLNIESTARLAQNPDLSPRDLAQEWAAKQFGPAAAPKVADMLMFSSECIRKMVYVAPYARKHKGWLPSRNIMRDDVIRGINKGSEGGIKLLYDDSRDALDEALNEKSEALALATRMKTVFESAKQDIVAAKSEQEYDEAHGSLVYLESLAEVMCRYVRGMFLYYRSQETRDANIAARAKQELMEWQSAWQRYQTEIPKQPGVASLYRSQYDQKAESSPGAMADVCEAALKDLARK